MNGAYVIPMQIARDEEIVT